MSGTPPVPVPDVPTAFVPRIRAERVVAVGRVLLSALALATLLIDPSTPAQHAFASFVLLAAFLAVGLLLVALAWLRPSFVVRHRLSTHILDMAVFASLMYLTEGPNSPFFLFFSLSLVAAALRWEWRGVAWTAVVLLITYGLVGLFATLATPAPPIEADRFFLRTVYLAVLASSLVYLGWYEARLRGTMALLADWSTVPSQSSRAMTASLLRHITELFGATATVLVWDDPDEPWSRLDTWDGQRHTRRQLPPVDSSSLMPMALRGSDFIVNASNARAGHWVLDEHGMHKAVGTPVPAGITKEVRSERILSLEIRSAHTRGRLFVGGARPFATSDFVTGRVAAHRVAAVIDYLILRRRLKRVGAREERGRLSRDLHDGLLQSLTGAALQLEAVDRMWEREPARARMLLRRIQRFVGDEQRDLRFFIDGLRPGLDTGRPALSRELLSLGARFHKVWGLDVRWDLPSPDPVPRKLRKHVYSIIREALANSARHGRATAATVRLTGGDGRIDLAISDNGSGFHFQGRCTHEELEQRGIGPVSLRTRIGELNGTLAIESSPSGALLEIGLGGP